ncbi:hypothetical protein C1922_02275 [Stenotrophomonas sp. ZAC14D2_NAIMI4_7]|nr:hypothetical protein C1922_02275 [Stenotrophomonas sp. ZAC14D2_NAIMI4_7]
MIDVIQPAAGDVARGPNRLNPSWSTCHRFHSHQRNYRGLQSVQTLQLQLGRQPEVAHFAIGIEGLQSILSAHTNAKQQGG